MPRRTLDALGAALVPVVASMRPRRDAAENRGFRLDGHVTYLRFNEAAA